MDDVDVRRVKIQADDSSLNDVVTGRRLTCPIHHTCCNENCVFFQVNHQDASRVAVSCLLVDNELGILVNK